MQYTGTHTQQYEYLIDEDVFSQKTELNLSIHGRFDRKNTGIDNGTFT